MSEKISFCTTCMGRRHHLEQTYRRNLETAQNYPDVEFVLLDYHSPDGLGEWVQRELREWMEAGIVRYFRTEQPRRYHSAHAKNVAHRLATGDLLVNLDADNYFAAGFSEEMAAVFWERERVLLAFAAYRRGCMGRIAIRREDFMALGGYNETFTGWGYDDEDLKKRAEALGLARCHFNSCHAGAIQHSNRDRTRFMAEKRVYRNNNRNHLRSMADLAAGRLVANAGREWGRVTIIGESAQSDAPPSGTID